MSEDIASILGAHGARLDNHDGLHQEHFKQNDELATLIGKESEARAKMESGIYRRLFWTAAGGFSWAGALIVALILHKIGLL